jgi:2-polyprenyl-6-hydroxyphenyl methylase/3-demethylubiquinone-9 3-methyltransferase
MRSTAEHEIGAGERFPFGRNWRRFLEVLDEQRIETARRSLIGGLGEERIAGRRVLDVGCGSGLFSLAALRSGASRVHSFDFDPESVACARVLRRRFPGAARWTVEIGSILDEDYVRALGRWDVVYAWGVLHHTGDLWRALGNASTLVAPGGALFVAIYNDDGLRTRVWHEVKRLYNRGPAARLAVAGAFIPYFITAGAAADLVAGKNPLRRYLDYSSRRGMSFVHDWLDWLGGLPFEPARPEAVFAFLQARGFALEHLRTSRAGCNEFVFSLPSLSAGPA